MIARVTSSPTGGSKLSELLILCARIGFNP
jgi:hypothetical protein